MSAASIMVGRTILFRLATLAAVVGSVALPGDRPYHDPKQVRQIHAQGHEVASHSHRHEWLPGLSPAQLMETLRSSKAALEDCIGSPVRSFVPPFNQPFDYLAGQSISFAERREAGARRTDLQRLCETLGETGYRFCRVAYRPLAQRLREWWAGRRLDRPSRVERIASVTFDGGDAVIQLLTTRPTTPSGKIDLSPAGLGDLRFHEPCPDKHPLVLLTPASNRLINSIFGEFNLPSITLKMAPGDAAARGLREREVVRIYNDLGEVHVPLHIDPTLRAGIVVLPKGAWCSSTRNGSTSTALIPADLTDIGRGACFNDARVEVGRLGQAATLSSAGAPSVPSSS